MIFESSKLKLEEISTIHRTDVSECMICRDLKANGATLYTVLYVKDHATIHAILQMYEDQPDTEAVLVDSFSAEGAHILVYPYRKERRIDEFYRDDTMSLGDCEDICINVILACMTSGLPWPLLYLVLRQRLLNLNRDNSVYVDYAIDLRELEAGAQERDCVVECAKILLQLLENKSSQKADTYLLLNKKIDNQSYFMFTELFRDVRIAAVPKNKKNIFYRITRWFQTRSDAILGILFWVCLILGIVALALFVSNLAIGDIPWLRLFINTFKTIGTESLLQ